MDTSCANLMAQRIQSCCSTRVSSRSALQVQRIYCRKKAHKSCSIFTVKENKMSTRPPNKTSCLPAHSNREMHQKTPPILVHWCLHATGQWARSSGESARILKMFVFMSSSFKTLITQSD